MTGTPYHNDPRRMQEEDTLPPMEDLPFKTTPTTPTNHEAVSNEADIDLAEARQDEARTVKFAIGKFNDFLQWFTLVMEVTLAVRFIFKLIGADPTNGFAGFLYALTDVILYPFLNIVTDPRFHPYQYFAWTTLIGMGIYYLVFWAIRRFLHILISEPEESTT